MTKFFLLFILSIGISNSAQAQNTTIRLYDTALFFDGYNKLDTLIKKGQMTPTAPDNVKRLSTSLYSKKITPAQLALIGDSLSVKIVVKAKCDNYDRIAQIGLAMVRKGDTIYKANDTNVKRIEIARFITPFMNKNVNPDTVPYFFRIDNLAAILRDSRILDVYDFWFELGIFGVPYAANTQVAGCSGRNDVFYGSVELYTNAPKPKENKNLVVSLANQFYLNNYGVGSSDSITKTEKTITFTLPGEATNAVLYLITSNHGAGTNGEEYARRQHYVYFDGAEVLNYKPGYTSCEPYRVYNTQGNGIYGANVKTDAQWQQFSNWCPGANIPIRTISLGTLAKGKHTFKLSVPNAVFFNKDGYFPLSLYLQAKSDLIYPADIITIESETFLYPNPVSNTLNIVSDNDIQSVEIFNLLGEKIQSSNSKTIDVSSLEKGMYSVRILFVENKTEHKTFVK